MKAFENAALNVPELRKWHWWYVDEVRRGNLVEQASHLRPTCGNRTASVVVRPYGDVGVVILESRTVRNGFLVVGRGGGLD